MAKIEFLTSVAGDDFSYERRQIADVKDADAERFVAAGYAKRLKATDVDAPADADPKSRRKRR